MQYSMIDLCAGIGGIRRGFEMTGSFQTISAAEIDESACRTYEHIYHVNPRNDVTDYDYKQYLASLKIDVLVAGFPCQAFSSVGLQQGFEDKTKGTIFFDIATIIKTTQPKVVFLENVQNLLSHDKGKTFSTIVETLDKDLNYHIVGLKYDKEGSPIITRSSFVRNSKDFGLPQNRPRVYIIAFNRLYYGKHLERIDNELPAESDTIIHSFNEVIEKEVGPKYFLSEKYLATLENHAVRQKENGNGFGYRIINSPEVDDPIANTLLATGGSGRERNLIVDRINGEKYAGQMIKGKHSPINAKYIRTMTPIEWGRLQGFIDYAFVDPISGHDAFSFPKDLPDSQKYKQLGNSVTIPVVEEMAKYIVKAMESMEKDLSDEEMALYSLYNNGLLIGDRVRKALKGKVKKKTLINCINMVGNFGDKPFRTKEVAMFIKVSNVRANQLITQLMENDCVEKVQGWNYQFKSF